MPYSHSHARTTRSTSATAMRPSLAPVDGGVNGEDGSRSSGGGEEPVPVVVALRLKPNPDNLPIAVQANPKKNTITMTAFEEEDNDEEDARENDDNRFVTRQFNYVFSESASQETTFSVAIKQFAPLVLVGYDLSVVAYGQSGAGKTYSMFGSDLPFAMNESEFGLVIRLIRELFYQMQQRQQQQQDSDDYRFYVRATFMDIEDDEARDILSHASANTVWVSPPQQQQDKGRADPVQGLTAIECATVDDVISCLESGLSIHKLRADSCNELSLIPDMPGGAAHSIFTVHIQQFFQEADGGGLQQRVIESTVRFVDLAGADKLTVNRGLLSLDGVVAALGDVRRNALDEPRYGDSLLTRILHDSLGGTSLTVLLCCVSPLQVDARETENAVRFACRAANISNRPIPRVTVTGRSQQGSEGVGGGRRDSDLRSVSVNRGKLPQIQLLGGFQAAAVAVPPFPSSASPPVMAAPDPYSNYAGNFFGQQPLSYDQIALYNYHLQQQMAAHLNPVGLLTPPSAAVQQLAFHHHHIINLSQQSSPLAQQPSPYSAALQMHLQSAAAQVPLASPQAQQQLLLQDPATVPISLSSRLGDLDLESSNLTDEDELRSEEAARSFLRQKLASIVEESENSTASAGAIGSKSSRQGISSSGDGTPTDRDSSFEIVSQEDFDSECSDVSAEEEEEEEDRLQENVVSAETIVQIKSDTRKLVEHFQNNCNLDEVFPVFLEAQSKVPNGQANNVAAQNEIVGCAFLRSDSHSQSGLLIPTTSDTLKQRHSLELGLLQIGSQLEAMKEKEMRLLQHSAELEDKEMKLMREQEQVRKAFCQADSLRRSYELKLNSLEKASSVAAAAKSLEVEKSDQPQTDESLRKSCKSLRHVQAVLLKQRAKQEKKLNELNEALVSLKEHSSLSSSKAADQDLHHQIVRGLQRNEEQRAELDEILSCLDSAIELKNELLCGREISFSTTNTNLRPKLDKHLPEIMSGLSTDECRAHVFRLLSRGIDLRVQSVRADEESAHLEHKYRALNRAYVHLNQRQKMDNYNMEVGQKIQETEFRKKYKSLEKVVANYEKENEEIKKINKYLRKFYRRHHKEDGEMVEQAAAAAEAAGRYVKQSAVIKDNRLIIPKK